MPDLTFYCKQHIYKKIVQDAQNSGLTVRQFLQQIVEASYDEEITNGN